MPSTIDWEDFLATEKSVLSQLLLRFEEGSREARSAAYLGLELASKIAAAKLRGEDTTIAERGLTAVRSNLEATMTIEAHRAVVDYIEGALIRAATLAGKVLERVLL